MPTLTSTLYPPLIDTFMPAFPYEGPARAAFSVSPYNSYSAITKLHVSLVDQRTNKQAFAQNSSSAVVPAGTALLNGVWILPFGESDQTRSYLTMDTTNNKYTINIPASLLKNQDSVAESGDKTFVLDNYYKLQLRFDRETEHTEISSLTPSYLTTAREYFSEWSSVCLLKAIPQVSIYLDGFYSTITSPEQTPTVEVPKFNPGVVPIVGNAVFTYPSNVKLATKDQEHLVSYQITITDTAGEIVKQSDVVYTKNNLDSDKIYWLADLTNVEPNRTYDITVVCITKNNYSVADTFEIQITSYNDMSFHPVWNFNKMKLSEYGVSDKEYIVTEEDGFVTIDVEVPDQLGPGYLYIKRATSLDKFTNWEIIQVDSFVENLGTEIKSHVVDKTVGSLVRYKYACQYRTRRGVWSDTVVSPEIVYPDFYDILLSRQDKQLAIRYNGQISNFKPVVNRVKVDTLGGKYPRFLENAKMNYRQFSISGMIISEADYNRQFLSDLNYRDEMAIYDNVEGGAYSVRNDTVAFLDEDIQDYGTYAADIQSADTYIKKRKRDAQKNWLHDLYPMDNWWWERRFREEAMAWLNDGEPKLFRSMAEGNMIVMLTDVTLTPNNDVGRRTYNFTATAYEVGDGYSLDELDALGVFDVYNAYDIENAIGDPDSSGSGSSEEDEDEKEDASTQYQAGQIYSRTVKDKNSIIAYTAGDADKFDVTQITVLDMLNDLYTGLMNGYAVNQRSCVVRNVKISFESEPQWYLLDDNITKVQIDDDGNMTNVSDKSNIALGYKLGLKFRTSNNATTYIFVNDKGYYQVPSNMAVTDIILFDGATATIDYILSYKVVYNETLEPDSVEVVDTMVGQVSGRWNAGTDLDNIIKSKYKFQQFDNRNNLILSQEIKNWSAMSFDLAPYTQLTLRGHGDTESQTYVCGRTGVYNLMTSFPMDVARIEGRRMTKAAPSRAGYLDEWEYVLDNSANAEDSADPSYWVLIEADNEVETDTLVKVDASGRANGMFADEISNYLHQIGEQAFITEFDIEHPQYNTVYAIINAENASKIDHKIYYLDQGWYLVDFLDDEQNQLLAKVPVYGMVNYRADLIRSQWVFNTAE